MLPWERDQISNRTKAALAAAKARGVRLGVTGPANLKRNIEARQAAANVSADKISGVLGAFHADGLSLRATVQQLNALEFGAPSGGNWSLLQVQRVLKRLALPAA